MALDLARLAVLLGALCSTPSIASNDAALDAVLARCDHDPNPDLRGVVVLRDGRIVAERYYNGGSMDTLHDVRSAGKSVTALLIGIAIDQHKLRSVDDRVADYWLEARGSAIGEVAIKDLLTMRSGLAAFDEDPASPGNEDRMDAADDPLALS